MNDSLAYASFFQVFNVGPVQVLGKRLYDVAGQGDGMRKAMDLFLPRASGYDHLIVLRFDLRLFVPIPQWNVRPEAISFASKCELGQWAWWNCSSDLAFIVPS